MLVQAHHAILAGLTKTLLVVASMLVLLLVVVGLARWFGRSSGVVAYQRLGHDGLKKKTCGRVIWQQPRAVLAVSVSLVGLMVWYAVFDPRVSLLSLTGAFFHAHEAKRYCSLGSPIACILFDTACVANTTSGTLDVEAVMAELSWSVSRQMMSVGCALGFFWVLRLGGVPVPGKSRMAGLAWWLLLLGQLLSLVLVVASTCLFVAAFFTLRGQYFACLSTDGTFGLPLLDTIALASFGCTPPFVNTLLLVFMHGHSVSTFLKVRNASRRSDVNTTTVPTSGPVRDGVLDAARSSHSEQLGELTEALSATRQDVPITTCVCIATYAVLLYSLLSMILTGAFVPALLFAPRSLLAIVACRMLFGLHAARHALSPRPGRERPPERLLGRAADGGGPARCRARARRRPPGRDELLPRRHRPPPCCAAG